MASIPSVSRQARIKTDCSLNWVNPDDGTRYCFSSGTSLEFFLDKPHASIARARAAGASCRAGPAPDQLPNDSATMR